MNLHFIGHHLVTAGCLGLSKGISIVAKYSWAT